MEEVTEVQRETVVVQPAYPVYRIVYYILDVIELILAIRFILRFLGANAGSPFVQLVYTITAPLVAPFRGIFPAVAAEGSVLEWSTLIAMAIYALLAYLLVRLIIVVSGR